MLNSQNNWPSKARERRFLRRSVTLSRNSNQENLEEIQLFPPAVLYDSFGIHSQ
jgi:hypothetical protein